MIKAFKFGLLAPTSGFDQSAIDVLFLRNRLWNQLVELEQKSRAKYRELMLASDTTLAETQARIDAIDQERVDLIAQKKKVRSLARSKKVDTTVMDAAIERLLQERTGLREKARALREKVKVEIKPRAQELDKERYETVKKLIAESGLWWGNSETVVASYDVARVKAMKENAELRFKRFDGTGKYAVRQSGGFSLEELTGGTLSFARIDALPAEQFSHLTERGRSHKARHTLTLTVYTYTDEQTGKKMRHQITWPIILHRDIPQGTVKMLHVQRKRIGDEFTWSCSITIDVPEVPKTISDHSSQSACGIDLGFRETKDGLRVATLAGSDGALRHLHLPQDWLDGMDHVESLQSRISEEANLAWEKLKAALGAIPAYPEQFHERVVNLLKAGDKVPVRGMRALHHVLKAEPEALPTALSVLDEWSRRIHRPYREMHNLRDKLINRRKDLYRNFAIDVARKYVLVRMEDMDLRKMAQVKKEDGSDNPLHQAARDNRKRAALYELALYTKQACDKTGAQFEKMEPAYSTMACSTCGHLNHPDEDIHFSCENCHTVHDQDENAAKNFLRGEYLPPKNQSVA